MVQGKSAIEKELKLALPSKADLEKVRLLLGGRARAPVRQENHFFDSVGGALDQAKHACRVRREGDEYLVTVKGPTRESQGGLLSERSEEEVKVSADDAAQILQGRKSPLSVFSTKGGARPAVVAKIEELLANASLVYVGGFKNNRTRVDAELAVGGRPTRLVFELDETTFPGNRVDYEFEVEVPAGVDAAALRTTLEALCRRAGVTPGAASSKLKRFMAALRAQAKE
jgi:uncharacterized protein YjbK